MRYKRELSIKMQVYCDGELVGYIDKQEVNAIEVAFAHKYSNETYGDGSIKWIPTIDRFVEFEEKDHGPEEWKYLKLRYCIPNYADQENVTNYNGSRCTRFSWKCVEVNIDDLVSMFDSDQFIPI